MRHVDLLGTHLKSDFFCDLFETYDIPVVYDFDRLREGQPDRYTAEVPRLGLEFVFDENQILETCFVNPVEISSYSPLAALAESVPLFDSKGAARAHARESGQSMKEGCAEFSGEMRDWIRFDYADHTVHYEFRDSRLALVTLQRLRL